MELMGALERQVLDMIVGGIVACGLAGSFTDGATFAFALSDFTYTHSVILFTKRAGCSIDVEVVDAPFEPGEFNKLEGHQVLMPMLDAFFQQLFIFLGDHDLFLR